MDRLTADDRLMLWSDEVWPPDIGALAVLDGSTLIESDGRFRIETDRDAVKRRLHLLPRFRQRLYVPRRGLGWPLWVDAPEFDLRDHVRVAELPDPAGEAHLLRAVEQILRRRLDPSRPLWEMWFLPGLPAGRVGLFVRLHHVIGDGIAELATLGSLLDTTPDLSARAGRPWTPAAWPSTRELLVDNLHRRSDELRHVLSDVAHPAATLRHARAAWPALREFLGEEPGPRTSLNRLVGPRRRLALVRSRLEQVSAIAHAHDATVNDVLLAMTAGGLRELLRSRGEPVEELNLPHVRSGLPSPQPTWPEARESDQPDRRAAAPRALRPRNKAAQDRKGDSRGRGWCARRWERCSAAGWSVE